MFAGNRLKLELFRRFGVLPGSADTHVAEFFPASSRPRPTSGGSGGCTTTGSQGHIADKWDDERGVADLLAGDELRP